jgi:hypothetical protein
MEVALLRLPPVDASFWEAWEKVHPVSAEAARQAYEVGTAELAFEPAIDTVTEFRRSRTRVLARITSDPPAAAGASRCWELLTHLRNPGSYDFEHMDGPLFERVSYYAVASWPLLCPWQPELAAAHLLRALSPCLVPNPGRACPGAAAVMGLTRSSAPLGPIGHVDLRHTHSRPWRATSSRGGRLAPPRTRRGYDVPIARPNARICRDEYIIRAHIYAWGRIPAHASLDPCR